MKRDPRLRPLSRDHHHALALALRATRAAQSGDPARCRESWDEVSRAFDRELEAHFGVEERLLLPPLREAGEDRLVDRTLDEHARLRELARRSPGDASRLAAFGRLLGDHVRFEERVLFPAAEAALSPDQLAEVERA